MSACAAARGEVRFLLTRHREEGTPDLDVIHIGTHARIRAGCRPRPMHVREALDPGPAALCRQDRLQNLCATVQVASGMTHSMALCAVPATGHETDDAWGGLDSVSTPDPQGPKLADARRSWVTRAVRVAQGGVPAGATRKMGMGSASDLRGGGPRVGSGHPPPAGRRPRPWHLRHLQRVVAFGRAGLCSRPCAGGARTRAPKI